AERARAALVDLAERLEVPSRFYADQTVAAVINALESQRHRYILIFDGVEDDEIHDLVPSFGGHVIITTRDPSWAHDSATIGIEISDFDRAEAFQFLRRRGSDLPATEAEELIRAVGRLPLVLEQIVAVRDARGWSWADLVQQIAKPDQTILSAGQPAHYAHNVEVTLHLAMTQLGADNPIAAVAFEMFAWFGSEPVSIALMKSGVRGEVSAALLRVLREPVQFPKTLSDISRYGLARLNSNTQRVEVQPFVRLTLRDILTPEARERARQNVHEILMAADPGWPDDLTYLGMHREIAPHVLPSELISSRKEAAQQTVVNQIRYRYLVGDHENAARLAEEAVTTWKQPGFLGPDHAYVLQATREWANALRAIGRYREARDLTTDAMERLHGPEFGENHPHTLALAMGYAADLRIVGRYRDALEVDNDNHRRHVLVYGEDHGRTATSRHNVAVSLRHVGEFVLAAASDSKELAQYRGVLGEEHSATLLAAHALAEDQYGLGQFADALDLLLRYVETSRRVLGRTHRDVLLAERTMGLAYRGAGQIGRAVDALRDHFYDCVDSFGADHEYTLAARMSYANALRDRGSPADLTQAHLLAEEAAGTYQRIFDPRNPLTLVAEVNLACILRAEGKSQRARQLDALAYEALRDALGERHPYTITTAINRVTDLSLTGDRAGALELSEEAFRRAAEGRGPSHPHTLAAGANLVLDRMAAGATESAEELLEHVLGRLRRTLTPEHPMVTAVASGIRIECDIEPPAT
ncbi:MAG: tetratricopeptide repeat protein, partial [Catenulispora sp.]|nr:tetratricopeptide repeat protein [Catenulispora sp.]